MNIYKNNCKSSMKNTIMITKIIGLLLLGGVYGERHFFRFD